MTTTYRYGVQQTIPPVTGRAASSGGFMRHVIVTDPSPDLVAANRRAIDDVNEFARSLRPMPDAPLKGQYTVVVFLRAEGDDPSQHAALEEPHPYLTEAGVRSILAEFDARVRVGGGV